MHPENDSILSVCAIHDSGVLAVPARSTTRTVRSRVRSRAAAGQLLRNRGRGKPLSRIAGITFSIYKDQTDAAPLWTETQNIQADSKGNYSIQLGAPKADGLPVELFCTSKARWLGAPVNSGEEQPRVMLLSVPLRVEGRRRGDWSMSALATFRP